MDFVVKVGEDGYQFTLSGIPMEEKYL